MPLIESSLIFEFNIRKITLLKAQQICHDKCFSYLYKHVYQIFTPDINHIYEYNLVLKHTTGFFLMTNNKYDHYIIRNNCLSKYTSFSTDLEEILFQILKISNHLRICSSTPKLYHYSPTNKYHSFSLVSAIIHPVENTYPTNYYIFIDNKRIDIKHYQYTNFGPYNYRVEVDGALIPYMHNSSFKKLIDKLYCKQYLPRIMSEYDKEYIINIIKNLKTEE